MSAIELIAAERARQIAKGWTPQHDDEHDDGELIYAAGQIIHEVIPDTDWDGDPDTWGIIKNHERKHAKEGNIRLLTIAAALIVAEIERRQRNAANAPATVKTEDS